MLAEQETSTICKQSLKLILHVSRGGNRVGNIYYMLAEWETDIICKQSEKLTLYVSRERN